MCIRDSAYTVSEEWIGQALEELGLRDEFILATKCRALTLSLIHI